MKRIKIIDINKASFTPLKRKPGSSPPEKYPLKSMKINETFFVSENSTKINLNNIRVRAYQANVTMAPKQFIVNKVHINGKLGLLFKRIK